MKRIIVATIALGLALTGCSKEKQEQIGGAPSRVAVKASQIEAQQLLRQISMMQETYYRVHKSYSRDFNELGMELPMTRKYRYSLSVGGSNWKCTATANLDNDATVDTWAVDKSGVVSCQTNDATS